ncbi:DinB family protein [soil metagenome]
MKYLSNQLLDELYDQTEKNIVKAITEWQQLSSYQLPAQPATGQWSALQCLEHLNSYGRYYLPAITSAISMGSTKQPSLYFKSSLLGNYFYKLMLPQQDGKLKKKMKSPKDHQPATQLDAAVVLSEFISQQELLGQLLIKIRSIDINKVRVPISIAPFIKLKLGDTLLFFVAHIQRHSSQAERALASARNNI